MNDQTYQSQNHIVCKFRNTQSQNKMKQLNNTKQHNANTTKQNNN